MWPRLATVELLGRGRPAIALKHTQLLGAADPELQRSISSTGGTARTPQDTRGHAIVPVRDCEAPGSNPGPPTKFNVAHLKVGV
jgi:hypothetical protein